MSARQSPCFTCLKGVAKLIKFRQNGHISMQFFSILGRQRRGVGAYGSPRNRRNGKRKSLLAAHFHSDMHDKEALSDRNVRMPPSHIPFLLFYFFTFLLFKRSLLCIINKACLHCKQAFFSLQRRLLFKPVCARRLTHWVRASYKIINICGRVPTSGAASWVSTRGNGSLSSSRFLPRRSRRTSPIALPCCRRLRGRCPELPALPL